MVGGGSGVALPGEVSLAHRGVLFLDELAEFPRGNLDSLRQPLEDGFVTVARRGMTTRFPSSFQLVAASNPCPCGFHGDRRKPCECSPAQFSRHRLRVSGPLLDRIDLVVKVGRLGSVAMERGTEDSSTVRNRVEAAVAFRQTRPDQRDGAAEALVRRALDGGLVTARGSASLLRVARTVADLAGETTIGEDHVAEALGLRGEF